MQLFFPLMSMASLLLDKTLTKNGTGTEGFIWLTVDHWEGPTVQEAAERHLFSPRFSSIEIAAPAAQISTWELGIRTHVPMLAWPASTENSV